MASMVVTWWIVAFCEVKLKSSMDPLQHKPHIGVLQESCLPQVEVTKLLVCDEEDYIKYGKEGQQQIIVSMHDICVYLVGFEQLVLFLITMIDLRENCLVINCPTHDKKSHLDIRYHLS